MGEKKAASDVLGPEAKREGGSREKEAESDVSAGEKWMSFQISAPEIGMNAEQIERGFEFFTQVDESTTCSTAVPVCDWQSPRNYVR